jgi:hypothetical protein
VGETRVDLQHLLEDLRDAYSGAVEETILTEIVANALDSGAACVRIVTNAAEATLTVVDDGRGMKRRELARYHDVAASTKSRGEGIGFAGVGIKLGLLVARDVVTETRRGASHVATRWHLASRHRAPWKWIPPSGLLGDRGTAVKLSLENQLSPLLDAGYLEETVRRHFAPLLDPTFRELLARQYPGGVLFEIDGRPLTATPRPRAERAAIAIRLGRRRRPSALGVLERHEAGLPDARQGIAISTFGKVIKRGWDWLGVTPAAPSRISGLIEAPELAACLTLSKSDFLRTGPRGATYLGYRKAIQEVVSRQLAAWGDAREGEARPRTARLERDLEKVLEDLSDDFPLLRSLVDRRPGGQKRLPLPGRGDHRVAGSLFANIAGGRGDAGTGSAGEPGQEPAGAVPGPQGGEDPLEPTAGPARPPSAEGRIDAPQGNGTGAGPAGIAVLSPISGRRRPARYGLLVQFESRPEDAELGRLVDNTIWINDAHPAYARAVASRSAGYHVALSVALALAPLASEGTSEHAFITRFLSHWGGAADGRSRRHRRR